MELLRCPSAPIDSLVQLGEARWLLGGQVVASVPLMSRGTAELDVREPMTFWEKLSALLGGAA